MPADWRPAKPRRRRIVLEAMWDLIRAQQAYMVQIRPELGGVLIFPTPDMVRLMVELGEEVPQSFLEAMTYVAHNRE